MVFKPTAKDLKYAYVIMGVVMFLPLAILIAVTFDRGELLNHEALMLFGVYIFIVLMLYFETKKQRITLNDHELSFRKTWFNQKSVSIDKIKIITIGFAQGFSRRFYVSTDAENIEINIGIWGEDAIVAFLRALREKNPNIHVDERYIKAINLFGTDAYTEEKKLVENKNTRIILKMAAWSLVGIFVPLAAVILWASFI